MSTTAVPQPAEPSGRGGPSELERQERRLAFLLLLPTFIILVAIAFYPLGSVFYYSLTDRVFASSQETNFVGLDNYRQLLSMKIVELPQLIDEETGQLAIDPETGETLYERAIQVLPREPVRYRAVTEITLFGNRYVLGATDPDFIRGVWDTTIFTVLSIIGELILGMGIALVVNANFKGRGLMRVAMLLPWVIPTAVSSRIWEGMLASTRTGIINVMLIDLGIIEQPIAWLVESQWQLPSMIIIDVWKTTSFMALLFLAGLQLIPADLYEAADVDGAGRVRQFFSITLPLLRPTIAVALIFRTLDALRVFDLFQIVLAQSRYSMASYAYYELINSQRMGYSSAVSVVILVIITIFAVFYIRQLGGVGDE